MKNEEILKENNVKKFDIVLMNPPYDKDLHLKFLEKCIEISNNVISIQPATFLVNLRKDSKLKHYNKFKEKIDKHVKFISIENYNDIFKTGLFVPYMIINIDNNKTYDEIEFDSCGYKKYVKSIYDCNLIGNKKIIESILNKVKDDVVSNHVYKPNKSEKKKDNWYLKISGKIITGNLMVGNDDIAKRYQTTDIDAYSIKMPFGTYERRYISTMCFANKNGTVDPQDTPPVINDRGNKPTDKEASAIVGTKEEVENWKYFVTHNKLPIFISILMTINQNNKILEYVPWCVDHKYSDEEIYKKYNIAKEEQKFIDDTLKKFERQSPWKIRLMCGPNSISDNEINNFFNKK